MDNEAILLIILARLIQEDCDIFENKDDLKQAKKLILTLTVFMRDIEDK
jgi:hypothetical protein